MKHIGLLWRDHTSSVKAEKFSADDFNIRTEPGWLKIGKKDGDGPFRWIPSDKVVLVEFAEEEEPSRISAPGPIPVPNNFKPS